MATTSTSKGKGKGQRAAARNATRTATKAATRAGGAAARWTEEQVELLLKSVAASPTAKAGFTIAATELGKSVGTVQQKYYALQRKQGSTPSRTAAGKRRGRPPGTASSRPATTAPSAPAARASAATGGLDLRTLSVDELTGLARRVKGEVDRRRTELESAARLFG